MIGPVASKAAYPTAVSHLGAGAQPHWPLGRQAGRRGGAPAEPGRPVRPRRHLTLTRTLTLALTLALALALALTLTLIWFAPGGIRRGASGHDVAFIHPKGVVVVVSRVILSRVTVHVALPPCVELQHDVAYLLLTTYHLPVRQRRGAHGRWRRAARAGAGAGEPGGLGGCEGRLTVLRYQCKHCLIILPTYELRLETRTSTSSPSLNDYLRFIDLC